MELLAVSRNKTRSNSFHLYFEENTEVYKVEVKSEEVETTLIETLGLIVIEPIPFGERSFIPLETFEMLRTPEE